ncbi:MAG TPA: protein kinase [Anaeromyxobacteraceae bacterium]|nr:protein kinase [Anaeromyxobacteraceae bacterium]
MIGRFELVRELGRGGFGLVWEAKDRALGRNVAFKAVVAGPTVAREERALCEAEAAARLMHPNIVTLYDVGRCEDGPYLVLELLRGDTLAARVEQGPLSVREALRIAVEVTKGLAHAHEHGVVHRDLTPGNIFLCEDGQVKVLDLGMAHAFGHRKLDGGTPAYMAPEQAQGAPEDERTDVFALGVVLYRMLSGVLPFERGAHHRWKVPPQLDVPDAPGVGAILRRMLAVRPTDRPRTAGEVLAALKSFEGELQRAGSGTQPVRRRRRASLRITGLVVLAIAFGVMIAIAAGHWKGARPSLPGVNASIAVLPFADLSPEHDQEYLADGVAEELLNGLAQVDGVRVPARTSSFSFKGKQVDLAEIGHKLAVTHLLQGSVRRAGQRVRVAAQLVNAADGSNIWSHTFEGDLADIFAVQDQVARGVLTALEVRLLPQAHVAATSTSSEAYAHYLIGRQMFYTNSDDDVARAVKHFERAIELDPRYAPAWAFLANAITQRALFAGFASAEDRERAVAAADRAIALSPEDAIGYVSRTYLRQALLWDWTGARSDIERALTMRRTSLNPYNQYSILLGTFGRTSDAIAAARRATEIDPLNGLYWGNLAYLYVDAGELELARAAFTRAMEIIPDRYHYGLGLVELLGGHAAAALPEFERHPREMWRLNGIAMAQHDLGRAEESDRTLQHLMARYGERDAFGVAEVLAWRGERDRAFDWLERALTRHEPGLPELRTDPLLRRLRGDPRFATLERALNLP